MNWLWLDPRGYSANRPSVKLHAALPDVDQWNPQSSWTDLKILEENQIKGLHLLIPILLIFFQVFLSTTFKNHLIIGVKHFMLNYLGWGNRQLTGQCWSWFFTYISNILFFINWSTCYSSFDFRSLFYRKPDFLFCLNSNALWTSY